MKDHKMNDSEEITLEEDSDYSVYLNRALTDYQSIHKLNESQERKIIKIAKFQAKVSTILIILAILLLVLPVLTLGSCLYYSGKKNLLLDIVSKTIYVTEPNTKLGMPNSKLIGQPIDKRIGIFSMDALFPTLKRIGKEDIRTGEYDVHFLMDQVSKVKYNHLVEKPVPDVFDTSESTGFLHPDEPMVFDQYRDLEVLNGMTSGTVAELYVSFDKIISPDQVKDISTNLDIDIVWVVVDTGSSQKDDEGVFTAPIGYPFQPDDDFWSPFFVSTGESTTNEERFISILNQLSENEQLATKVSRALSLSLPQRLAYIKEHGVQIYGMVVTGPVDELKKLETNPIIRTLKVEDSRIWNWHS